MTRTAKGSPAVIPTPVADGDFIYSAGARGRGRRSAIEGRRGGVRGGAGVFLTEAADERGRRGEGGRIPVWHQRGGLLCLEFTTGTVKWDDRSIGAASLCYADGRLYLHGENGEVALVEATPEAYHEKGRFKPTDPPDRGASKAWAYPVIANGRLYIRDIGTLWCYDVKAGK